MAFSSSRFFFFLQHFIFFNFMRPVRAPSTRNRAPARFLSFSFHPIIDAYQSLSFERCRNRIKKYTRKRTLASSFSSSNLSLFSLPSHASSSAPAPSP